MSWCVVAGKWTTVLILYEGGDDEIARDLPKKPSSVIVSRGGALGRGHVGSFAS
jgi:hypothetical protein